MSMDEGQTDRLLDPERRLVHKHISLLEIKEALSYFINYYIDYDSYLKIPGRGDKKKANWVLKKLYKGKWKVLKSLHTQTDKGEK